MPHIDFKKMAISNILLFLFSIHIFIRIFFIFNSHGINSILYNYFIETRDQTFWGCTLHALFQ